MAKRKAGAKQHPEAKLLLFENYSHCLSTLSSKIKRTKEIGWKNQAKEQVCLCSWDYTINHNEIENENEK